MNGGQFQSVHKHFVLIPSRASFFVDTLVAVVVAAVDDVTVQRLRSAIYMVDDVASFQPPYTLCCAI